METITVIATIDDDKNINLTFKPDEIIKIETSGDVDLSEYVKKLTILINEDVKLSLGKFEDDDSKLILIQQTIENITNSFNESFDIENGVIDEEDPF